MTKKVTKKEVSAKKMASNIANKTAKKAVENLDKKVKVTGLQYNPKNIKVVFDKKLVSTLSEYYAVRMELCGVAKIYSNNVTIYNQRLEEFELLEKPTKEQVKANEENKKALLKSNACFKFFKRKIMKSLKASYESLPTNLYETYLNRFNHEKEWFDCLKEINDSESLVKLIDKVVGAKSATSTKRDVTQIDNLGEKPMCQLVLDTLCQVALDKAVLSKKVIVNTITEDVCDIEEFKEIVVVERPTTIKGFKEILVDNGIEISGLKTKENFIKAYKKAISNGIFVEIQ